MKKGFLKITAGICASLCAFGFVACAPETEDPPVTPPPPAAQPTSGEIVASTAEKVFASDYFSITIDFEGEASRFVDFDEVEDIDESIMCDGTFGIYAKKTLSGYDFIMDLTAEIPMKDVLWDYTGPVEEYVSKAGYYYIGGQTATMEGCNASYEYVGDSYCWVVTEEVEEYHYSPVTDVGTVDEWLALLTDELASAQAGTWTYYLSYLTDALFEDGQITREGLVKVLTDGADKVAQCFDGTIQLIDGKYAVGGLVDVKSPVNDTIDWIKGNKDLPIGNAVLALLREKGAISVTDAQFVQGLQAIMTDGKSVAAVLDDVVAYVNSFIPNAEDKINLKQLVDELQQFVGLTTTAIVDFVREANPSWSSMLVNPLANETAYDYFYKLMLVMPFDSMFGMRLSEMKPFVGMFFDDGDSSTTEYTVNDILYGLDARFAAGSGLFVEALLSIGADSGLVSFSAEADADKVLKQFDFSISMGLQNKFWSSYRQGSQIITNIGRATHQATASASIKFDFSAPSITFAIPTVS